MNENIKRKLELILTKTEMNIAGIRRRISKTDDAAYAIAEVIRLTSQVANDVGCYTEDCVSILLDEK